MSTVYDINVLSRPGMSNAARARIERMCVSQDWNSSSGKVAELISACRTQDSTDGHRTDAAGAATIDAYYITGSRDLTVGTALTMAEKVT
jgi:hypothetical protein